MKYTIYIFIVLLAFSCKEQSILAEDGNTFFFENPQPINDSELRKFPSKYIGVYIHSDSLYLDIQNHFMIQKNIYKFSIAKTTLDSLKNEIVFTENEIIVKEDKSKYQYRVLKDSIELTHINLDTIFKFSENKIIKRINGNLVWSEKDSIYWRIRMLSLEKETLKIKHLYSEKDILKMDSITEKPSQKIDSTTFIIRPTRKEFGQFFKIKNFGYDQNFTKIKE